MEKLPFGNTMKYFPDLPLVRQYVSAVFLIFFTTIVNSRILVFRHVINKISQIVFFLMAVKSK